MALQDYDSIKTGCNFHPKLFIFGALQVAWVQVDVGSDLYQAYVYYGQGHYYWSMTTSSVMFIPIFTSIINEILTYLVKYCHGNTENWSWKKSLKRMLRHFPLAQPFVHLLILFKLQHAKDEVVKAQDYYKDFDKKFNPKDLTIGGNEIMSLG